MTESSRKLLIPALIKPNMEGHVVTVPHALPHVPAFAISRNRGLRRSAGGHFHATEYNFSYQEHLQIEIVCASEDAEEVCDLIARADRNGSKGDGVIFSSPSSTSYASGVMTGKKELRND